MTTFYLACAVGGGERAEDVRGQFRGGAAEQVREEAGGIVRVHAGHSSRDAGKKEPAARATGSGEIGCGKMI